MGFSFFAFLISSLAAHCWQILWKHWMPYTIFRTIHTRSFVGSHIIKARIAPRCCALAIPQKYSYPLIFLAENGYVFIFLWIPNAKLVLQVNLRTILGTFDLGIIALYTHKNQPERSADSGQCEPSKPLAGWFFSIFSCPLADELWCRVNDLSSAALRWPWLKVHGSCDT